MFYKVEDGLDLPSLFFFLRLLHVAFDWFELSELKNELREVWIVWYFTLKLFDELFTVLTVLFLVIINEVEYDSKNGRLDFSHVQSRILLADDFVESAKAATEGRVEMVLDVVISSK